MKTRILMVVLICVIIMMGCNKRQDSVENEKTSEIKNEFFYEMNNENEKRVQVLCELKNHGGDGSFEGTAVLEIKRIEEAKEGNYYILTLTDLDGTCSVHSDDDLDCVYCDAFGIGYFYVGAEDVYQMNYTESFLDIFKEIESFPPTEEYVENYNQRLKDEGKHYGYFGYELVCTIYGVDDTFEREEEEFETLPKGVLNYNYGEQKYHNYIEVDEEKIKYNLYPEEMTGSDMYKYITWHKNKGIVDYASWSGEYNRYISFSLMDE